jgi:hypothetical protein
MKKIKDIRISIIKFWAQPFADFLIMCLDGSTSDSEFNNFYTIALYFDYWCQRKGVYLD